MAETRDQGLILKILSGPHLGAEVGVRDGELTIGRQSDCDLVLNDRTVAPRHGVLRARAGRISVAPLDGTVLIAGAAIGGETALEPFQLVSFGTTSFAIGPAGARWPEILVPSPRTATEAKSEEAAARVAAEKRASPPPPAAAPAAPPVKRKKARSSSWPYWLGSGAILLIAGIVGVIAYWLSGPALKPPPVDLAKAHMDAVKQVLRELGGTEEVSVTPAPGDTVRVTGYVKDAAQRAQLRDALNQVPGREVVEVWATDMTVDAVQTALDAQGFVVAASYAGDGVLALEGVVEDRAALTQAINQLLNDVPGITSFEDRTLAQAAMHDTFMELLNAHGLQSRLDVQIDGNSVVVKGRLSEAEMARWQEAESEFLREHGEIIDFQTEIEIAAPEAPQLVLDIAGVGLGGDGYFVTGDGGRYGIGAMLPNGMKVLKVERDKITLARNGETLEYAVPDDVNWIVESDDGG
jgi:type III secretion system YscD/HrpQ family protein